MSTKSAVITYEKSTKRPVIALGGNPNVGKSTVFNGLTGLKQHTGNWTGKTVTGAYGLCEFNRREYEIVDLPGCYSLAAHSAEEKTARDFICFGGADVVVIVCDATSPERSMVLVLQALEITRNLVVCVNLTDEAEKKGIRIDFDKISRRLGVPVTGAAARSKKGLDALMNSAEAVLFREYEPQDGQFSLRYPEYIEKAAAMICPFTEKYGANGRQSALELIAGGCDIHNLTNTDLKDRLLSDGEFSDVIESVRKDFKTAGITAKQAEDDIAASAVRAAEDICKDAVHFDNENFRIRDAKIDRILTGKFTAFPIMLLGLLAIFWLTIAGANYPSQVIGNALLRFESVLAEFFAYIKVPVVLSDLLVYGVYRVLASVVSVMLPPMAVFFPLFTLMEDAGVLPRIAFNLDNCFKKCSACGKQALTMCMGFGCNAAGVVSCRIIDSPRERLIAVITNSFVPCNGRFPALIAIISMFFVVGRGAAASVLSAAILTLVIVLGIIMTFAASKLLSETLLKGIPSSFTLELPPYRKPRIGKVVVRSVFDRTLFVLARAVSAAAPAGLVLWIAANVTAGDMSLLAHCSTFLDPFASLFGMDGIILMAFILGFPANEIVIPIIIMAYTSGGVLPEFNDMTMLKQLLINNGWTWITAVNVMLFSLMHWPCSTTCLTIKKETGSFKWTVISILLPAAAGFTVCFIFTLFAKTISGVLF